MTVGQEEEIKAAVDAGIAWLEREFNAPWTELRTRLTKRVNIKSMGDCALAQLSGMPFVKALAEHQLSDPEAHRLGFSVRYCAPYCSSEERTAYSIKWIMLQAEWDRRVLLEEPV